LQARQHRDVLAGIAISHHAVTEPVGARGFFLEHRGPRHGPQTARIDTLRASFHAFAAERAGLRPSARSVGALASSHEIEHAGNDVDRSRLLNAGRFNAGTALDALA